MRFLDKMERKFGKFAIKGLMLYIVSLNLAVYLLMYVDPTGSLTGKLMLYPGMVLRGEVWRLLTFIFVPPETSVLWILFTLYFYYLVGTGLEQAWGSFKFNVYYLIGVLGTILSAFISGGGTSAFYLNLSLFLAFAYIYPNYQILLFFILPIKVKYLAWVNALFLGLSFVSGGLGTKLAVAAAVLNFILFFGKDIVLGLKNNRRAYFHRSSFSAKVASAEKKYFHKCVICGITEKDDKDMEFRYCMDCEGDYEYCMVHLREHEHIKKGSDNK